MPMPTLTDVPGDTTDIAPVKDRKPTIVPVTAGDARLARSLSGWSPATTWDTTLRDSLDHHRRVAPLLAAEFP